MALRVQVFRVDLSQSKSHQAGVVFLDRDGVVTVESGDYVTSAAALTLLPGAPEAIVRLNAAGWRVVVVTNQAGVGRGHLSIEQLETIHAHLRDTIRGAGGDLDAVYACPHRPEDGCDCRKPKSGLLRGAAADLRLDLAHSFMVGDSPRDIAAGHAAGCTTVLVMTGHTKCYSPTTFPPPQPDMVMADLPAASEWICGRTRRGADRG